jgi:hypothetical protein
MARQHTHPVEMLGGDALRPGRVAAEQGDGRAVVEVARPEPEVIQRAPCRHPREVVTRGRGARNLPAVPLSWSPLDDRARSASRSPTRSRPARSRRTRSWSCSRVSSTMPPSASMRTRGLPGLRPARARSAAGMTSLPRSSVVAEYPSCTMQACHLRPCCVVAIAGGRRARVRGRGQPRCARRCARRGRRR